MGTKDPRQIAAQARRRLCERRPEQCKPPAPPATGKGLGDALASVFEATGVTWLVHKIWGQNCGCQRRRDWLNWIFSSKR